MIDLRGEKGKQGEMAGERGEGGRALCVLVVVKCFVVFFCGFFFLCFVFVFVFE